MSSSAGSGGRAASGLRPVAEQGEEERGGPGSILARQSADHAELRRLMVAYDAASDPDRRGGIVAEFGERALRHAFAEETVLFPAYRRHLPDEVDGLTAHIEGEHQQVNEILERLRGADPRDPGYDGLVRRSFAYVTADARDEEDALLPRLQQVADAGELRAIGAAWEAARTASPTRPHPRISRRPPGNVLAGAALAVIDRVKDAVEHPVRPRSLLVAGLAGLAVLAITSGAVAAAPALRARLGNPFRH